MVHISLIEGAKRRGGEPNPISNQRRRPMKTILAAIAPTLLLPLVAALAGQPKENTKLPPDQLAAIEAAMAD